MSLREDLLPPKSERRGFDSPSPPIFANASNVLQIPCSPSGYSAALLNLNYESSRISFPVASLIGRSLDEGHVLFTIQKSPSDSKNPKNYVDIRQT